MCKNKTSSLEVIYFEINNWWGGEDYPDEEPFVSWLNYQPYGWCLFASEVWVKENELVVSASHKGNSLNFCVTALRDWVEKNCPNLLAASNSKFVYYPKEDEVVPIGKYGCFYEYKKPYIGEIIWDDAEK